MDNIYMRKILPTKIGVWLAKQHGLDKILSLENDHLDYSLSMALADFQRMAMVKADKTVAMRVFESHCKTTLTDEQKNALGLIYDCSAEETMGVVMENLLAIMSSEADKKSRIAASLAITELMKGNKPSEENLNRLIVKLTQ